MRKLLMLLFFLVPVCSYAGDKNTVGISFQSSFNEIYAGFELSPVDRLSLQAMAGMGGFNSGPSLDRGLFGKALVRIFTYKDLTMTGHVLYGQWDYSYTKILSGPRYSSLLEEWFEELSGEPETFDVSGNIATQKEVLTGYRFGVGIEYYIKKYNIRVSLETVISPLSFSEISYKLPEKMMNLGFTWYLK